MTSMSLTGTIQSFFVGAFATATLDVWAMTLNRTLGAPVTDWARVGRWVRGILSSGTVQHPETAAAPRATHDRLLGWLTHYLVGVIYAALYLASTAAMNSTPSVYSATLFGLATVLAPWLILQPGLGLGYFAMNVPKPNLTRALNLLSHVVFGIGLYLGWAVSMLET